MLETALKSFTTFFATVGPIEAAVLFATLTPKMAHAERQAIAMRATLIASTILAFFTLLGGPILNQLGVSIAALQTAGGYHHFDLRRQRFRHRHNSAENDL